MRPALLALIAAGAAAATVAAATAAAQPRLEFLVQLRVERVTVPGGPEGDCLVAGEILRGFGAAAGARPGERATLSVRCRNPGAPPPSTDGTIRVAAAALAGAQFVEAVIGERGEIWIVDRWRLTVLDAPTDAPSCRPATRIASCP